MAEKMATRQAYGEKLKELGGKYDNLVVMDADLSGSTKTAEFKKVYPERFFNMGICTERPQAWRCRVKLCAPAPSLCSRQDGLLKLSAIPSAIPTPM